MNKKNLVIILLIVILLVGGSVYNNKKNINTKSEGTNNDLNNNEEIVEDSKEDEEDINHTKSENSEELEVGKPILDFSLDNLDGDIVSVNDYKGKIILINFWATWCGFCDAEMPDLQRIVDENEDVEVLAVNVLEKKSEVEKYIKKGNYNMNVLLDDTGEVSEKYLVAGLPSSYFVDEDGNFVGRVPSMITYDQMNEIIENIRNN